MFINHWVVINGYEILRNGRSPFSLIEGENVIQPMDIFTRLHYSYSKWYKMDLLCKWAWLGAEYLLAGNNTMLYDGIDKNKIAIVLATSHGCLEVDKKYDETIKTIPSPALFVYTLPNIMLGELSVRHGFKGEQACFVSEAFDADEIHFKVNDLLERRGMDACLCGWADVMNDKHDICLCWVSKNAEGAPFSTATLQQLYNTNMR